MIDRRTMLLGASVAAVASPVLAQEPTVHEVQMLNVHPEDPRKRMVFYPRILRIKPGETVRFIPTDPAHNCQTTDGMVPDGAEGWKGGFNKVVEATPQVPGVYGYNCQPHQAAGMVGLVIVEGEGMLANLEAAKSVRQIGLAKRVWTEIWAEAEAEGHLTA
ncbi:MAG: plastocyanin/azurin family copper-binding protein [Pseudomonadota bacterium]